MLISFFSPYLKSIVLMVGGVNPGVRALCLEVADLQTHRVTEVVDVLAN